MAVSSWNLPPASSICKPFTFWKRMRNVSSFFFVMGSPIVWLWLSLLMCFVVVLSLVGVVVVVGGFVVFIKYLCR